MCTKAIFRGKMKQQVRIFLFSMVPLTSMTPSCLEDSSSAGAVRRFHSGGAYTATVEVIATGGCKILIGKETTLPYSFQESCLTIHFRV